MNSRQLEYFLAVARELNFTKAAEKMYVSQTAVTQQIKSLEEQVGVRLFERTKKKVVLTPAGKVFQSEAIRILESIDVAIQRAREMSDGITGSLEIGFTIGMGNTRVSDILEDFNTKYPNISVMCHRHTPSELLTLLKEGRFDLIFTPVFDKKYFEGINYKRIDMSALDVVMPRTHPLAGKKKLSRWDLKDAELILACTPESKVGEDTKIIDSFKQLGYNPRIVAKVEDVDTILMMISANMGVSILPKYLSMPTANGRLVSADFGRKDDYVELICAWLPDCKNPAVERLIQIL